MPLLIEEKIPKELFRADGSRLDGRKVDDIRHFACKVGVLKNAQGSAYVEHGGNKIYAAVYGPREVHPKHMARSDRGILKVYYRMATFSVFERKSPAPNRREVEISKVIREALEPVLFLEIYPDSAIEIFIEIVAADGGTRCASVTAASLALADASIPMKSLVVGLAAGKANGKVILDCSDKEDKVGDADVPISVIMRNKDISLLQFDGQMTPDELHTAFAYVLKGAEIIYQKQIEALKKKYDDISLETIEENKIVSEKMGTPVGSDDLSSEEEISEEDFDDPLGGGFDD
jgi:exosome complex component RRP41